MWLSGSRLHVANVGAALDRAGVQALCALRASGKGAGSIGRFGVGFTAVLSLSDEIEIRSTSGSVRFSASLTRQALRDNEIATNVEPAVLRLPWPTQDAPSPGWDTEVVLGLRSDVDGERLLPRIEEEAVDLLLELEPLRSVTVHETTVQRVDRTVDGRDEVTIGSRRWWQHRGPRSRWLVPVGPDDEVRPVGADVLRAPTRSDEELSLPAIVVASIEMQPDRRRVLPGAPIGELARGYPDFVAALPSSQRPALVPAPGFARSEVDGLLREALLRELREWPWLPVVGGDECVLPTRARMLPDLTEPLAELLAEVIADLLPPGLSTSRHGTALAQVGVHRIGLAGLAELLGAVQREPDWWAALYAALEPLVVDNVSVEELGALPVPLADGRTVTGPRTVVLGSALPEVAELPVHWARLVHPRAAHELLGRLGAQQVRAADLLADPALRDIVDTAAETGHETADLADAVLALAGAVEPAEVPGWLGALALPDETGELRLADELLLPEAPLAEVLVDDAPFGTVDRSVLDRHGERALRAIGVGWAFTVVRDELPTGPDHDLDDEQRWWAGLSEDPDTLLAVRDLDLVDDTRWVRALQLLADDPVVRPLLADRTGYTAWWLRRHARPGGVGLGSLRRPSDPTFAGLLDPCELPYADALTGCLADAGSIDTELAQVLIDALADADRAPTPAVVATVHGVLADAVARGVLDVDAVNLPQQVRAVTGALADPETSVVLDIAWLASVVDPDRVVVGVPATAAALARLLDVALASEAIVGRVLGDGRPSRWENEAAAVLACAALGLDLPAGPVTVHGELLVELDGAVRGTRRVPVWFEADGSAHLDETWGRR